MSLTPAEEMLEIFDALCIGEGEYPGLELVEQLSEGKSPSGIMNLWIKQADGIEKNPTRPFLQDMDELPFPDREMWNPWTVQDQGDYLPLPFGNFILVEELFTG